MSRESLIGRISSATNQFIENQAMKFDAQRIVLQALQGDLPYDQITDRLCQIAVEKSYRIRDFQRIYDQELQIQTDVRIPH